MVQLMYKTYIKPHMPIYDSCPIACVGFPGKTCDYSHDRFCSMASVKRTLSFFYATPYDFHDSVFYFPLLDFHAFSPKIYILMVI